MKKIYKKKEENLEEILNLSEKVKKKGFLRSCWSYTKRYMILGFAICTLFKAGHSYVQPPEPTPRPKGPNIFQGRILLSLEKSKVKTAGMNFYTCTRILWEYYEDIKNVEKSEYRIILTSTTPMGTVKLEFIDEAVDGTLNDCYMHLKQPHKKDKDGIDRIILHIGDNKEVLKQGSDEVKLINAFMGEDIYALGKKVHKAVVYSIKEKLNKRLPQRQSHDSSNKR